MLKHYLLVLICCTLMSCERSEDPTKKKNHQMNTLRFNFVTGDMPTLHPHVGVDLCCRSLEKALFEGLTRLDAQGILENAGAQEVEISDSKTRYVFHLRPNRWSNGAPVTAKDYELTWKKALSPGSECRFGEYFYIIKNGEKAKKGEISLEDVGVKAIGDNKLVVELEYPAPYFLGLTATALFSPLYLGESDEPTLFNGPFMVTDWKRDHKLCLAPNPHYWDRKKVQLDAIEASMVKDDRVAFEMYEKGDLHLIGDPFSPIPQDAFLQLEKTGKLQKRAIARVYFVFCNTRVFPLQSKKIRQALDMAIDRQELSGHILHGQRGHQSPVPSQYSLIADTCCLQGDPAQARALFEEGLKELDLTKDDFPTLTYSYDLAPMYKNIAQYLQRRWAEVLGIQVNLQGCDWHLLFADLNRHKFELSSCFYANFFNDPVFNLAMYEDASHKVNWTGWENSEYKSLLDHAKNTVDLSVRNQILEKAERMLVEERPSLPLHAQTFFYMTSENLEGLEINDLGYIEFKHVQFKKQKA